MQPVAIAYTRVHGMAMGRYFRPLVSWPGDVELMPHLKGILREERDRCGSALRRTCFRHGGNGPQGACPHDGKSGEGAFAKARFWGAKSRRLEKPSRLSRFQNGNKKL